MDLMKSFIEKNMPAKEAPSVNVGDTVPLYSPVIEKVETIRKGKVRRAKLYYLRGRVGKAAKVKEKL